MQTSSSFAHVNLTHGRRSPSSAPAHLAASPPGCQPPPAPPGSPHVRGVGHSALQRHCPLDVSMGFEALLMFCLKCFFFKYGCCSGLFCSSCRSAAQCLGGWVLNLRRGPDASRTRLRPPPTVTTLLPTSLCCAPHPGACSVIPVCASQSLPLFTLISNSSQAGS